MFVSFTQDTLCVSKRISKICIYIVFRHLKTRKNSKLRRIMRRTFNYLVFWLKSKWSQKKRQPKIEFQTLSNISDLWLKMRYRAQHSRCDRLCARSCFLLSVYALEFWVWARSPKMNIVHLQKKNHADDDDDELLNYCQEIFYFNLFVYTLSIC